MVRTSRALLKNAGAGINKTLMEILVCPLSKQPLRVNEDSGSLVCDDLGVSYPIVDGIPCLVPKDGKLLETDCTKGNGAADSSTLNNENQGSNSS
ncbi:PREDICTED: uncharacterized protein LOC104604270 [Nelumbo nucifera]|uniref:Protein preY, mitochondrial n=2 Tax=Nelumbo nucifera TaxID=4432 RepID=A0A822ZXU7_NELNU|nr:PREDICTED: uncharacterized protein LOC104604270 [Nelumbo nucifera]DAD46738.1 TPA_asm: hypothetical protein HUJ06_016675 [Nelumbo nucifera]